MREALDKIHDDYNAAAERLAAAKRREAETDHALRSAFAPGPTREKAEAEHKAAQQEYADAHAALQATEKHSPLGTDHNPEPEDESAPIAYAGPIPEGIDPEPEQAPEE